MSIFNNSGTIVISGADFNTKAMYKLNNSDVVEGQFYIANGTSSPTAPAYVLAITGEIGCYFIYVLELTALATYDISGICAPCNSTVYLSKGFEAGNTALLNANIITRAQSDSEGAFSFSNIVGIDGPVSVWINVSPVYAQTASVSCKATITHLDEVDSNLLYQTFTSLSKGTCGTCEGSGYVDGVECSACNGDGIVEIADQAFHTISGKCPSDVSMVYVSRNHGSFGASALSSNMVASVEPENGEYTIAHVLVAEMEHIVWTTSETGGILTIDGILLTNKECLSGDTIIAMADGSERRLDSLEAGDVVISDKGLPTKIRALCSGSFNPCHTIYYFEDGTTIDETHLHRFYNVEQGFWQALKRWNIGEHAINKNGEKIALISVEHIDEPAEKFGIWTVDGSYYANGLLSGDTSCNKRLLADASADQAVDMMLSTEEHQLLQLMGLEGIVP